jgi:hypothetical protein
MVAKNTLFYDYLANRIDQWPLLMYYRALIGHKLNGLEVTGLANQSIQGEDYESFIIFKIS